MEIGSQLVSLAQSAQAAPAASNEIQVGVLKKAIDLAEQEVQPLIETLGKNLDLFS